MKKLICILMCAFCLLGYSAQASGAVEYYMPDISCVVTLDNSWLCITRQTKEVDLRGTPYNYEAMYQIVDQITEQFTQDQFQELHCYLIYYSGSLLLECHILGVESPESIDLWDMSLVPSTEMIDLADSGFADVAQFLEIYTSAQGDIYVGIDSTDMYRQQCDRSIMYLTINNGRVIQVQIASAYPSDDQDLIERAHQLLDSISFTEKAPKPTSPTGGVKASDVSENRSESRHDPLAVVIDFIEGTFAWFVNDYLRMTSNGIILTVVVVALMAISGLIKWITRR